MDVLNTLRKVVDKERVFDDGTPSLSFAVLHEGKIASSIITNSKHDEKTLFQACSISKAITGLAVAKLVDDGLFTYDTPVVNHLPQSVVDSLVDAKTAHLLKHVTVRMLLSHTSGLSQHGFPGYASPPYPTVEEILSGKAPANTPRVRFTTLPGAEFSYSGGGFTVLQVFLEHVTGTEFALLMDKTVLKPLQMTHSAYGECPNLANFAPASYTAWTAANSPAHYFLELAAAGLWTTPTDLLKAIAAIQSSLQSTGGFVQQATAREMLTAVEQSPERYQWGLGWGSDANLFAHSGGNDPGYRCYVFGSHGGVVNAEGDSKVKVPAGWGFAAMTNSIEGAATLGKVLSAVFCVQGWPRYGMLPGGLHDDDGVMPYPAPEGTPVKTGWQAWEGGWEGDKWALIDLDGKPYWECKGFERLELVPAAAPVEKLEDGEEEHVFVIDGLVAAIRCTRKDSERVVELLQNEKKLLHRTKNEES